MYVRDLEDGCLLEPSDLWTWRISKITEIAKPYHGSDANVGGMEELAAAGVYHSVTMVSKSSPLGRENPGNPGVYVGKHMTKNYFFGLKTHHLVIVDGLCCAMDGYSFRDVQKV
jgi:hypothetical protein